MASQLRTSSTGHPGKKDFFIVDTLSRLEEIRNLSAWTAARSAEPSHPPYRVDAVPHKGLGLVAARVIECGEKIVSELPLLLFGSGLNTRDIGGLNRVFADAVDGLSPTSRAAYLDLANPPSLMELPYLGRRMTNAFKLWEELYGGPSVFGESGGVFRDISRANHSCTPNAHFDFATTNDFEGSLYAVLPIRRGEEICISYIDCHAPTKDSPPTLRRCSSWRS